MTYKPFQLATNTLPDGRQIRVRVLEQLNRPNRICHRVAMAADCHGRTAAELIQADLTWECPDENLTPYTPDLSPEGFSEHTQNAIRGLV